MNQRKFIMKRTILSILILAILFSCSVQKENKNQKNEHIEVVYPETYELSNIILALTDYGKTDKWQVRKDFPYYEKMRTFFKPVENHPLLDSTNYSREKWKEYLSFRTDAYAFYFDKKGKLKRNNNFYSFSDVHTFDDNLKLIQDFVDKSKFRNFFSENKDYRNSIIQAYKKEYLLNEMKNFLTDEFGDFFSNKKYIIVLSPFVYAQNLHRDIDSLTTADFPTIAKSILEGKPIDIQEKSTEMHTLFTEMAHGYVNPITDDYKSLVSENFDENIWATKSGYENQNNAVFNEYMTWAVYNIFNKKYFPKIADEINMYWHFQNDSRGFIYSNLFAQQLEKLHQENPNTKLKDSYRPILEWTKNVQSTLTKTAVIFPKDSISVAFTKNSKIKVEFSEGMKKLKSFNAIIQLDNNNKTTIDISDKNNLQWSVDGKEVTFNLDLSNYKKEVYLIFNWWNTKEALKSQKGIMLKSASYFKIKQK